MISCTGATQRSLAPGNHQTAQSCSMLQQIAQAKSGFGRSDKPKVDGPAELAKGITIIKPL